MVLHDRAVIEEAIRYYAEALIHMIEEPVEPGGDLAIARLEEDTIFRLKGYGTEEAAKTVRDEIESAVGGSLLLLKIRETSVSISEKTARITVQTELKAALQAAASHLFPADAFEQSIERDRRMDPEEFIRLLRGTVWRKKDERESGE